MPQPPMRAPGRPPEHKPEHAHGVDERMAGTQAVGVTVAVTLPSGTAVTIPNALGGPTTAGHRTSQKLTLAVSTSPVDGQQGEH